MPSNKNAVIRYMYLDQMLSDRYNKYTCEDLLRKVNERLELAGYPTIGGDKSDYDRYIKSGKRVIQLDLQALQDSPFNMEIDSSERLYGAPVYRYSDQTQSLFNKQLSDDEKRLLQEVLNTLGQFAGLDNFEWLQDLQEKLNDQTSFCRMEFDKNHHDSRKVISFSSNNYLAGKDHLGILFSLISNKKVVDITYKPFGADERTIRLYPYLLKQYNDRWYLIGTPMGDDTFKYRRDFYINLPLDRINSISAVEGVEYVDCDDSFEERFDDIIGVTFYEDIPVEEILIAVKRNHAGYIETKPLHGSQIKLVPELQAEKHLKYPTLSEYDFYNLSLRPNREFYSLLYQFGLDILVISPESIRLKAANELKEIVSLLDSISCE